MKKKTLPGIYIVKNTHYPWSSYRTQIFFNYILTSVFTICQNVVRQLIVSIETNVLIKTATFRNHRARVTSVNPTININQPPYSCRLVWKTKDNRPFVDYDNDLSSNLITRLRWRHSVRRSVLGNASSMGNLRVPATWDRPNLYNDTLSFKLDNTHAKQRFLWRFYSLNNLVRLAVSNSIIVIWGWHFALDW